MRIGYYIPGWPPDKVPNGIVATLERLGEALEKLGHEVYFLTPSNAGDTHPRVTIVKAKAVLSFLDRLRWKFNPERTNYINNAFAIRKELLQLISHRKIEIFEMEETHGWVETVAKGLAIPVVTRLHGPWFTYAGISFPHSLEKRDRNRIEKEGLAIQSAFAITAPSRAILESTRDFYGNFSGFCKVIPNPIPQPLEEKIWSHEKCDKSTILFVGRFDDHKGGDIVLRAFSELLRSKPDLRLNFVGPDIGVGASMGKQIHFSDFIRNQISPQVAARINYLGKIQRSDIDHLRRSAAMTIVASRYETFGGVVTEAMAVGAPLIATHVGGIPEIVENNRNALLVEPNNPLALASACLTLLGNPQLAIKLGTQARTDCSEKYIPAKIAAQTVEFYTEVIEKFFRNKPRK